MLCVLPHPDYRAGVLKLGGLADYLVINISSPNTPGTCMLLFSTLPGNVAGDSQMLLLGLKC